MRGLHTLESARLFMDGWLVHYNFFRPHLALRDLTPAQVAEIRFTFRNWKDIVQQPYEITARIPLVKPLKTKRKTGRKRPPKRPTPPVTTVSAIRRGR